MKNKKNQILIGIIVVLLVVVGILSCIIMKKNKSDITTGNNETTTVADTKEENSETAQDEKTTSQPSDDDATETKTESSTSNPYELSVNESSSWEADGKKCATSSVDIKNNTNKDLSDWKVVITYASDIEISDIWGAEKSIDKNVLTLTSVDYTEKITAGGTVNLGYNISADDLTVSSYSLYADGKEYTKEDIEAAKEKAREDRKKEKEEKKKAEGDTEEVVAETGSPVDNHGKLSVSGTDLVDKNGKKYQLKGCSTHGITWFPEYVNKEAFQTLRDEWGANLIRIAMYTDTGDDKGYASGNNKDYIMGLVDDGVSYATELGMYVIVDWHILNDNNPNNHIDDAKDFFETVSSKYSKNENVIYEICNEPNGGTTWDDVKTYAQEIIPIIRENDKDAIIIVGTPTWSQDVDKASEDPITGYDNIMYAVHFYAATHKQDLRDKVTKALNNGLPIFVSEFSICDASGNGAVNYDEADLWFDLIDDKNLSFASWSLCNKNESASLIDFNCKKTSGWTDDELSDTGLYIKDRISE